MSQIIKKADLIRAIAHAAAVTQTQAETVMLALANEIRMNTAAGHIVPVQGLGRFKLKESPARTARNPRTGEPVQVAASSKIVFTAAK